MLRQSPDFKFLKILVYFMGIVLILGVVIITYILYKRNVQFLKYDIMPPSKLQCISQDVTVDIIGDTKKIFLNNNDLIIINEKNDDSKEIIIFDYCNNLLKKKIKINSIRNNQNNETIEKNSAEVGPLINHYTG